MYDRSPNSKGQTTVTRWHRTLEKIIIKWLPLAFLTIWLLLVFNPSSYKATLRALLGHHEYSLIEIGTAFGFLAASALALWVAFDRWRDGERLVAGLFVGFALLAFFVCMEEVQWVQPLLEYEIPAAIGESNEQNEMTLHNLKGPHRQDGWFYLVFCIGAWMLTRSRAPFLPVGTWALLRIDDRLNTLVAMIAFTGVMKVAINPFGNPFAPASPVRWTTEITELYIALWCVVYTLMKLPQIRWFAAGDSAASTPAHRGQTTG